MKIIEFIRETIEFIKEEPVFPGYVLVAVMFFLTPIILILNSSNKEDIIEEKWINKGYHIVPTSSNLNSLDLKSCNDKETATVIAFDGDNNHYNFEYIESFDISRYRGLTFFTVCK